MATTLAKAEMPESILDATQACLRSFNECLTVPVLGHREWVENRLADFSLWAAGVGASAKESLSLDSRLVCEPGMRTVVIDLLKTLIVYVHQCKNIGLKIKSQRGESNATSSSPTLMEAMEGTEALLDQLANLAVVIRQAGTSSRLQKADRSFNPAKHGNLGILLKVLLQARPERPTSIMNEGPEDESPAKDRNLNIGAEYFNVVPDALDRIQDHFVCANLRRRNRFIYAQRHARNLATAKHDGQFEKVVRASSNAVNAEQVIQQHVEGNGETAPIQGRIKSNNEATESVQSRALISKASTFGPADETKDSRISTPSQQAMTQASHTALKITIPRPRKIRTGLKSFKCPCCCQTLPSSFTERNQWTKHLAQDLCPYTCPIPFDGCPTPFNLYTNKKSWLNHINKEHKAVQYWKCNVCDKEEPFLTVQTFSTHLSTHPNISKGTFSTLVEASSQEKPPDISDCPLCTWASEQVDAVERDGLLDHIAEHVYSFSLLSLPWADEEAAKEVPEELISRVQDWLNSVPWEMDSEGGEISKDILDKAEARLESVFSQHIQNRESSDLASDHEWFSWLWPSRERGGLIMERPIKEDMKWLNWLDLPSTERKEIAQHAIQTALNKKDKGRYFDENDYFSEELGQSGLLSDRAHMEPSISELDGRSAGLPSLDFAADAQELPEQLEPPPNSSVVIPFSRDTDFVERGILDQIYQKCAVPGSRTALVGLGGVGKSQLAIEYAYRTRDLSPKTWVFWVHASNAARFEQSFRDIANYVKISGRQNPQANIYQLVHDWLLEYKKGKWVLILDNVDDASFLFKAQSNGQDGQTNDIVSGNLRRLVEYLPQCPNGSILITTRSRSAALKLVEQRGIIEIEPMSKVDGVALFEKKLGGSEGGDDAAELAATLGFIPLAIVQAAAYISQRGPRYSIQQYLNDFRKNIGKRTSLLNYEGGQLRRDWEAKNSIIVTWQISFDHISEIRPSAADLLSLMSFFDRQGIPETLLRSRARSRQRNSWQDQKESNDDNSVNEDFNDRDNGEDKSSQSSESDRFEDDILALRNYSFISINTDGTTFEMHGLVQLATREWLKAHEQHERWKQQFIKNLNAEFPTGEYENWVRCQTLFPHAQSAIEQQPEEQDSLRDWASILYKAAWYAWKMGKGEDAEKMSVQAMKVRKKILGREHIDTLESMVMVGLTYNLMGQWDVAEELFVQVLEIRKTKLGADHPDTLTSMSNLASTWRNQGLWDAAEELEVQVMEIYKTKLGADHPDTLTSMTNLASTWMNQGRWDAAEGLDMQVLQIRKTKLGPDHPDTLTSMNNLAFTFWNQGRWDAAEELEVQVIETRKKKLGADHPDTLTSMANLASTYRNQGRWDAAEELEVQVIETRKKKLGADHPDTLTSMSNLASTWINQGRWDAAEGLDIQVLENRKTKLGPEHPDTLTSMANLASTYRNQGRWDAAEELEVEVMDTRKKKLGPDHPNTLTSMANLASTYRNQGRWDAAEELEVQVIETRKKKLGPDHPDTLTSMANLASTYQNQGRWDAAVELEVQVMETRKKKLGPDHPDTLSSMNNLAFTWKGTGKETEAVRLMEKCVQLQKRVLGINHPHTISSCTALDTWKAEQEDVVLSVQSTG